MLLSINFLRDTFSRVASRALYTSVPLQGLDSTSKRVGHIKKRDELEGESGPTPIKTDSYELIDENIMDRVFDNMKFKDIPVLHITCTRNNTKIALRSGYGTSSKIYMRSAGTEGFKNCRKGTTVAAQAVASRLVTYIRDHDINMVRLVFNGLGPGRGAAYKVIELSGIKVVSLSDRTEAIEPWIKRPRAAKSL